MKNQKVVLLGLVILALGPDKGSEAMQGVVSDRDEARVRSVIEAIGVFVDFGEFEAICQLYDDVSTSDYSSLWGNEPTSGSPSNRATGWSGFIPGFDTTRHDIAVLETDVEGSTARASASVTADHWLNEAFWSISGRYDAVLVKKGERWLISEWIFTLYDEVGDRAIVDEAESIAADVIERPIRCSQERARQSPI